MSFKLPGSSSFSLFSEYSLILYAGPAQLWSYFGVHRDTHTHTHMLIHVQEHQHTWDPIRLGTHSVSFSGVLQCLTTGSPGQERPALAFVNFHGVNSSPLSISSYQQEVADCGVEERCGQLWERVPLGSKTPHPYSALSPSCQTW